MRVETHVPILLAIALFAVATLATAGEGLWTPLGPDGGTARDLVVDPRNPDTLYVRTAGAGIFKSVDGGLNWTRLIGPPGTVRALTVVPRASAGAATVIAATTVGLWRSEDAGATWETSALGLAPSTANTIVAVAAAPSEPAVVYAASGVAGDPALFRSLDRGRSWEPTNGDRLRLTIVVVDPTDPQRLYAAEGFRILTSRNGGRRWSRLPFPDALVGALTISRSQPRVLWAVGIHHSGPRYEIFRSTNRGGYWQLMRSTNVRVDDVEVDPFRVRTVWAATSSGLVMSTNAGQRWTASGLSATDINGISFHPTRRGVAYLTATTPGGNVAQDVATAVFRTTSGGAQWAPATTGLHATSVHTFVADIELPDRFYLGIGSASLRITADRGHTYLAPPGIPWVVRALAQAPSEPTTLYLTTAQRKYVSFDRGATWARRDTLGGSVLVDPENAERLWRGGPALSEDGGLTWESLPYPDSRGASLALVPSSPLMLYGFTEDREQEPSSTILRMSTDGGRTWSPPVLDQPGYLRSLAHNPFNPAELWMAWGFQESSTTPVLTGGVWHSTDGGASWALRRVNDDHRPVHSVAADPHVPGRVAAVLRERTTPPLFSGVYLSTDSGASWTPLDAGFPVTGATVAFDPHRSGVLLAATEGAGVYELTIPLD